MEELEGSWLSDQLLKVNQTSGGQPKETEKVVSKQPPKGQKSKVKVRYIWAGMRGLMNGCLRQVS